MKAKRKGRGKGKGRGESGGERSEALWGGCPSSEKVGRGSNADAESSFSREGGHLCVAEDRRSWTT